MNTSDMTYGTIFYKVRNAVGLKNDQWILLSTINNLSKEGKRWAIAGKEYLSEVVGVSESTTKRMIKELTKAGWLESKDKKSAQRRVTPKYLTLVVKAVKVLKAALQKIKEWPPKMVDLQSNYVTVEEIKEENSPKKGGQNEPPTPKTGGSK